MSPMHSSPQGPPGKVVAVVGFTIAGGRIREIDLIGDRAKLQRGELE